jgi:catechol 2,3-dioxygenase-like lactoylglutathione lyase family enzyme
MGLPSSVHGPAAGPGTRGARVKDIDNINHVGMAVRDLAATVARYEAMGFVLTPFSRHSGAWKPGEPVRLFDSGNRCVMFANSYLEILASADPVRPSVRLAHYLKRHQGAHIICFNSEDPQAVDRRLREQGIATSGVIPLQRDVDTPAGARTAKFERIQFAPDDSPEGYIQAARHVTPDYIYQPRYTAHPNGCVQLSAAIVAVDDLPYFVAKYQRYLGAAAEFAGTAARFQFPLGSALTLVDVRRAPDLLPGTLLPPAPGIAAVAFRCIDRNALRSRLVERNVAHHETANRLIVPAEEASGVAVIFEE